MMAVKIVNYIRGSKSIFMSPLQKVVFNKFAYCKALIISVYFSQNCDFWTF